MKIAIMLALHNNPEQANIFINQCLSWPECEVFIHIDKKGLGIIPKLVKNVRVHIMPKSYDVQWGDYSQIEYVIYMMRFIREYGEFQYYSIHSGSDLLVRPMEELIDFLSKTNKYAFLDCHKLPWKDWQYGGGLGRLALIWPDCMRRRLKPHSILRYSRAIYGRMYGAKILKGKKLPKDIQFYGKSAWYTLRKDCVNDILNYLDSHEEFLKLFRKALCGDEIFFATIANLVSGVHQSEIVQDDDLRFVDFEIVNKKSVGSPKTLTYADKDKIINSKAFFARKVDISVDHRIVDYFVNYCSN